MRPRVIFAISIGLMILVPCLAAHAINVQLFDTGASPMSADQLNAFNAGAAKWEPFAGFGDSATIKVNIEFANLGQDILGSTLSQRTTHPYTTVRAAMLSDTGAGRLQRRGPR